MAITDKESEPAQLAVEFGCGLWAKPGDPMAIAEKISWAVAHPQELEEMGKAGRRLAETRFDKTIVINEWLKVINLLDN